MTKQAVALSVRGAPHQLLAVESFEQPRAEQRAVSGNGWGSQLKQAEATKGLVTTKNNVLFSFPTLPPF